MSVYFFIKLHINAQSDPVILVIICLSHLSSQGGSIILITKTSDRMRQLCVLCVYVCERVFAPGTLALLSRSHSTNDFARLL